MRSAIIFDFDGVIVDTELADLQAWQETFQFYGQKLDPAFLDPTIGAAGYPIDPIIHLEELIAAPVNREEVRLRKARRLFEIMEDFKPLPGVIDRITEAHDRGVPLAIASNSSSTWVQMHLHRQRLFPFFTALATRDEVAHPKPAPELYLLAMKKLNVSPNDAVAIEDSPPGILAARQAGLAVLAVPNSGTVRLDLSKATQRGASLADISLDQILNLRGLR